METAISRYILCFPLFLPSAALFAVEKMKMMPRNFALRTMLELSFFTCELYIAVPLAIAFYPQFGKIAAKECEPHIQDWKDENGKALETLQYNKGL